ncbi:MAG TPA: hypothetical protein VFI79_15215 [Gemmatimonadales bacterium]|nr:hypothetical protein [Gemmatimonadales bacterium]
MPVETALAARQVAAQVGEAARPVAAGAAGATVAAVAAGQLG